VGGFSGFDFQFLSLEVRAESSYYVAESCAMSLLALGSPVSAPYYQRRAINQADKCNVASAFR
jgi:hypothetical protein